MCFPRSKENWQAYGEGERHSIKWTKRRPDAKHNCSETCWGVPVEFSKHFSLQALATSQKKHTLLLNEEGLWMAPVRETPTGRPMHRQTLTSGAQGRASRETYMWGAYVCGQWTDIVKRQEEGKKERARGTVEESREKRSLWFEHVICPKARAG